ncbi:hypothetical protein K4K58_002115 [Colletotrichum sp. SAR11_239]|nr:hypothetical protein K4K58_002115 [Colletotrichum sp. SAR11_239]
MPPKNATGKRATPKPKLSKRAQKRQKQRLQKAAEAEDESADRNDDLSSDEEEEERDEDEEEEELEDDEVEVVEKVSGSKKGAGNSTKKNATPAKTNKTAKPKDTAVVWSKADQKFWEEQESYQNSSDFSEINEFLMNHYPFVKQDELDAIIPKKPVLDEDWSAKDEKALVKAWKKDPDRDIQIKFVAEILKMWKACIRFCKLTPRQLISKANHLEYDDAFNDATKRGTRRPGWTNGFCTELTHLLYHPLLQGKPGLVVIALQYASILRHKDWQDWPLKNPTGDPLFTRFMELIQEDKGLGTPIKHLHQRTRDSLLKDGIDPGMFSDFLRSLEAVAQATDPVDPNEGFPSHPYKVHRTDTTNVIQALDGMTHMGGLPTWGLMTKLYDNFVTLRKGSGSELPNQKSLPEYMERDILAVRREAAREVNKQKRIAAMDTPSSPRSPEEESSPPQPEMVTMPKAEVDELRKSQNKLEEVNEEVIRLRNEVRDLKRRNFQQDLIKGKAPNRGSNRSAADESSERDSSDEPQTADKSAEQEQDDLADAIAAFQQLPHPSFEGFRLRMHYS